MRSTPHGTGGQDRRDYRPTEADLYRLAVNREVPADTSHRQELVGTALLVSGGKCLYAQLCFDWPLRSLAGRRGDGPA